MVNYSNKRFFVIFLSLSLVLPIYGMEKSNGNIFSGIFKTIVNTIKSPFSYMRSRIFGATIKKDNCVENDLQILHETNNTKLVAAKISVIEPQSNNLVPYEKNSSNVSTSFIPLITILYLYNKKLLDRDNFVEKLITMKTKNESNRERLQIALNKARNNKKNKFSDEDCNEINNCLKQNIDVNFRDIFGRNQLHIMVEMFAYNPKQFNIEIFKNLLKHVKLDPDKEGVTPLGAMMLMPYFKGQNNKVNEYETVLSLLIDSVDANEINSELVTERKKAREYFERNSINRLNLNRLNNNIVSTINAATSSKAIIPN